MFVRAAELVRRPGLFRAENGADAGRFFATVEWHDSDRLLGQIDEITESLSRCSDSFVNLIGWKIGSQARNETLHGYIPFMLAHPDFNAGFQFMKPSQDTKARVLHIIRGQPSGEGMHHPGMRLHILWTHAQFNGPLLRLRGRFHRCAHSQPSTPIMSPCKD
jgi:hypothetical protein